MLNESILFLETDDMILEESLHNLYEVSLNYRNIDVIQFRAFRKKYQLFLGQEDLKLLIK